MGDQWNETVKNPFLDRPILHLNDHSVPWILKNIDGFNRQAQLDESIIEVHFNVYSVNKQGDEVWDKLGQAIGKLQALKTFYIRPNYDEVDDGDPDAEDIFTSDWEILARILSHVRQKIEVNVTDVLIGM